MAKTLEHREGYQNQKFYTPNGDDENLTPSLPYISLPGSINLITCNLVTCTYRKSSIIALFNNMRNLKFKSPPKVVFFTAVNQRSVVQRARRSRSSL